MNSSIKKGLYIKKPWTDLILEGKKTWELRGSQTHIREKIFIIESKTSLIVGECEVVDCLSLSKEMYESNFKKHQVNKLFSEISYKNLHAWVLGNVVKYKDPIPHKHKPGTVIWVNF